MNKILILIALIVLPLSSQAADFSFFDLQKLIETKNLNDIPSVIKALPKEMLSNYTYAYNSQSLQGSSFQNPRAILFTPHASFVITFNGAPTQAHYNELETVQYNESLGEWEFRSINFDQGSVRISEKNPVQCTRCHGANPQPIWDSYNIWPQVYGSHDDNLHDLDDARPELKEYQKFKEKAPNHERYKHLIRESESAFFPFGPDGQSGGYHIYRPANRLGKLLARQNAKRVSRLLYSAINAENSNVAPYSNTLMSMLLGCYNWGYPGFEKWIGKIDEIFEKHFPLAKYPWLYEEIQKLEGDNAKLGYKLEKIFLGLDVYTWQMNRNPIFETRPEAWRRWDDGILTQDQMIFSILAKDFGLQNDPALAPFLEWVSIVKIYENQFFPAEYLTKGGVADLYDDVLLPIDTIKAQGLCELLYYRSRFEVGADKSFFSLEPNYKEIKNSIFENKCSKCHNPNGEGKDVPLWSYQDLISPINRFVVPGSPLESRIYLAITRDDFRKMPPPKISEPLTKDEIDLIRRWIDQGAPEFRADQK